MSQHLDRHYRIIRSPHVTEKATKVAGIHNTYAFRVPVDANKVEIRRAIENLFEVKVLSVNTMRVSGKTRRRGWVAGRRPDWKKALVKLEEGQTIDVL